MLKKQFIKAVVVITILMIGLFFGLVTTSKADANTNQIVPEQKPLQFKVQEWAQNEWNDIKVYQTKSWESSKAQLNRNKEQVSNLFQNIADAVSNIITPDKQ